MAAEFGKSDSNRLSDKLDPNTFKCFSTIYLHWDIDVGSFQNDDLISAEWKHSDNYVHYAS